MSTIEKYSKRAKLQNGDEAYGWRQKRRSCSLTVTFGSLALFPLNLDKGKDVMWTKKVDKSSTDAGFFQHYYFIRPFIISLRVISGFTTGDWKQGVVQEIVVSICALHVCVQIHTLVFFVCSKSKARTKGILEQNSKGQMCNRENGRRRRIEPIWQQRRRDAQRRTGTQQDGVSQSEIWNVSNLKWRLFFQMLFDVMTCSL